MAEYRYGRQPAQQPCARPCRARYALVRGGAYVVPEDIKTVAVPVLAHRLQLSGSVGSTDAQKKAMTDVLSSVALPTEDWSK